MIIECISIYMTMIHNILYCNFIIWFLFQQLPKRIHNCQFCPIHLRPSPPLFILFLHYSIVIYNCVTKKTPETLELFPKETFISLMVVLQSSKSLDLCLDTFTLIYVNLDFSLAETFALKLDKSLCPVI